MKIFAGFMMIFFMSFLSIPTLMVLIEKDAAVSLFYNLSPEEEIQKDLKEIKADISYQSVCPVLFVSPVSKSKIISENLSKHDNVAEEILLPPPELS